MSHTKVQQKPVRKAPRAKTRKSLVGDTFTARPLVSIRQPERINIVDLRRALGLSQEELARITGYSIRSIAGWESGQQLSLAAKQKLTETGRLCTALAELMPPGTLGEWLRAPNPAFEGQTPIQVIERGEADRLWQMIFQIDANVAN